MSFFQYCLGSGLGTIADFSSEQLLHGPKMTLRSHWEAQIHMDHIWKDLRSPLVLLVLRFTKMLDVDDSSWLWKHMWEKLNYCIFCCFRYYYDNRDVKEDKEFGNFLNELSIDGKPLFHGRIGKVKLLSNFSSINCCLSLPLFLPNATNLAQMALHFKLLQFSFRILVWKFFMDLVTKLDGNFLIALLFCATGCRLIKSQKSKTIWLATTYLLVHLSP